MTQQPFSAAALRGAVDLTTLGGQTASGPAGRPATTAPGGAGVGADAGSDALIVQASDATFNSLVTGTMTVPAVMVLWAEQIPETGDYLQVLAAEARAREGRFRVIGVEIAANPAVVQALGPVLQQVFGKVEGLPVVMGLLQGQPVPFYVGPVPIDQVRPLLDKFLAEAVTNGVTGRVEMAPADSEASADGPEEEEAPYQQEAFEALERGDLEAASRAYQQALTDQPGDEAARLGLAQVDLLTRTQGLDPATVREAAAGAPLDVAAQIQAADLDLVGGHVEDAFTRLIDTVRRTAGEDRDAARQHLLGLFEVVGADDPRVGAARRALTSALF